MQTASKDEGKRRLIHIRMNKAKKHKIGRGKEVKPPTIQKVPVEAMGIPPVVQ